jgi:hypothetical protein
MRLIKHVPDGFRSHGLGRDLLRTLFVFVVKVLVYNYIKYYIEVHIDYIVFVLLYIYIIFQMCLQMQTRQSTGKGITFPLQMAD